MRKNKFLFPLLGMILALTLSGCGFLAGLLESEVPYPSESESIPENAKYYRSDRSKDTYYTVGKKNLYGQHYPNSLGKQNILVIPVTVKGYEKNATETNRTKIQKAFFGSEAETGWHSVKTYFNKSSFGQLNIEGEVTPWFELGLTTSQITKLEYSDYGDGGTYEVLNRAVTWAKGQGYKMKDYDLDSNGYIDCVWLVYSAPNYQNNVMLNSTFWAFTFSDYTNVNNANVNNPVPNMYAWASFDFMQEGTSVGINIDAHTYIHEHGHVMGLDDYYDYDELHMPLGGIDMQDINIGDHNAYSKIALGWSRPYVVQDECTITIKPAESSGHCILVRNPTSPYLGNGFSEYLLLELITPTGIWKQDSTYSYPSNGIKAYTKPGVRLMHVDARLVNKNNVFVTGTSSGGLVTHGYSNTPSSSYSLGTSNLRADLLALIPKNKSTYHQTTFGKNGIASNNSLFVTGDTFTVDSYSMFFKDKKLHDGTTIPYTITFENVTSTEAKITFSL